MDRSQEQQAYNGMSEYHTEDEDSPDDFDNGLSRLVHHRKILHRGSRIEHICAGSVCVLAFHFCSVAGIVGRPRLVSGIAIYVLLSPALRHCYS